jgi:Septum formation
MPRLAGLHHLCEAVIRGWQTRVPRGRAQLCATSLHPQRTSGRVTVVRRVSVVDMMLSSEPTEQTRDLAMAVAAIDRRGARNQPSEPSAAQSQRRPPRAASSSTRRALAIVALGGLLIGGVTVLTSSTASHSGTASAAEAANAAFNEARSGDCLTWPKDSPDEARLVPCNTQHLFEVAEAVDMRDSQQPCQLAVERYLGSRYDPNGKFTIGVLWSVATAGPQSGDRHLLCGLQLPGLNATPTVFKGKVAELDQSKVWPAGTCLGIGQASNQPTGLPVDCSAPHAEEITGVVNLAEAWPGGPPPPADQDAFIRDACTRATDAYLAPIALETTGLTMIYNTVSLSSWSAGSRQVSCGIGATQGDGGAATLIGDAKGRLLVNGVAPVTRPPVPDAPPEATTEPPSPPSTAVSTPQPSPVPRTTASPPPTTSASPTPSPSPTPTPSASPTPTATADPDAGQVIEIPGFPPFTLPRFGPPAPPPGT